MEDRKVRQTQDRLDLWHAASWSIVIAALLLIPYDALRIYWFLWVAPEQGIAFSDEGPLGTVAQRWEVVLGLVMAMPFVLAALGLAVFVVLVPIFLLGGMVRRHLLLPLRSRGSNGVSARK
jgi:hypothetical protein